MIISQLRIMLGLRPPPGGWRESMLGQLLQVIGNLMRAQPVPALLGFVVILVATIVVFRLPRSPAPLFGVVAAVLLARTFGLHEKAVGALPLTIPPFTGFRWAPSDVWTVLPDAFGLALLTGIELHLAQFGDAVHAVGDFVAELFPDFLQGADGVLDHVMQQTRFEAYEIHVHLRERQGDVQRVHNVRLARITILALVAGHGEPVGLVELGKVLAGARCLNHGNQVEVELLSRIRGVHARYRRLDGLAGLGCHKQNGRRCAPPTLNYSE